MYVKWERKKQQDEQTGIKFFSIISILEKKCQLTIYSVSEKMTITY